MIKKIVACLLLSGCGLVSSGPLDIVNSVNVDNKVVKVSANYVSNNNNYSLPFKPLKDDGSTLELMSPPVH